LELYERGVVGSFANVESQGQDVEGVFVNRLEVIVHVVEKGIFVAQVVVCFHFGIYSPVIAWIRQLFF
jgi:hypothetical protein